MSITVVIDFHDMRAGGTAGQDFVQPCVNTCALERGDGSGGRREVLFQQGEFFFGLRRRERVGLVQQDAIGFFQLAFHDVEGVRVGQAGDEFQRLLQADRVDQDRKRSEVDVGEHVLHGLEDGGGEVSAAADGFRDDQIASGIDQRLDRFHESGEVAAEAAAGDFADFHARAGQDGGVDEVGGLVVGDEPDREAAFREASGEGVQHGGLSGGEESADENEFHFAHGSVFLISCRSSIRRAFCSSVVHRVS